MLLQETPPEFIADSKVSQAMEVEADLLNNSAHALLKASCLISKIAAQFIGMLRPPSIHVRTIFVDVFILLFFYFTFFFFCVCVCVSACVCVWSRGVQAGFLKDCTAAGYDTSSSHGLTYRPNSLPISL